MSTWKITGTSADFTSDPEDLIESLLSNASYWVETDPAVTDVKFGNDTFDGYGDYQVHVQRGSIRKEPAANHWKLYRFTHTIPIHVYVRRVTEDKPDQWGKMERQIDKIITQQKQNVGQGVSLGNLTSFENMGPDDNLKKTWHSMATVELWYWKVDTS